jgi:hypothetical protein
MSANPENRKLSPGKTFLVGLGVGVVCYLMAESLTPKQVASPGDHDILLANRLGFIYTPIIGIWLGWLQRSRRRAIFGALIGVLIGFCYMGLCASGNFFLIMVGFPCLLGSLLAVVLGSNRSRGPWGFIDRLGKGLFAGFVLGFVYMVVLNVGGMLFGGMAFADTDDATRDYIRMMWRTGPIALGVASALFFLLIPWAVGLKRIAFEDVPGENERDAPVK